MARTKRTALITGITGQDGAHLSDLLLRKGYTVVGGFRRSASLNLWRMDELGITERVDLVPLDVLDTGNIIRLLKEKEPDEVYNLAAQSFVGVSFEQPVSTADVTGLGAARVLEAIRTVDPEIRFYQASSSEQFGKVTEVPQRETTVFHPRSPYAVAKVFAHHMTVNYREAYGIHASCGILFNHEGPLRGIEFVTRKISDGAARISLGLEKKLALGNLDAKRDWGYAPEYVDAMWRMVQQDEADDYVIATGETHSVRDFCREAFAAVDLDFEEHVTVDKRFLRPADVDLLLGNASKAKKVLDWAPKTTFAGLVRTMVERDVERLSARKG